MTQKPISYIPFARKYRPSKLSELLGQEVLVKTLAYCIANDHLPGAILLTGMRGIGKTSTARIIAKTSNCTNIDLTEEQVNPCNACKNCQSFNSSNHPDIIEIDAASKTGVDDIRDLIESSIYRPLLGRLKFFIIDEIHMLSKNAFNALLKVVEEPPEHVVFIFATTEVEKLPLTVVSRCQRYDLRRINTDKIEEILSNISRREKIKFDDSALKLISLKSEGSARDAIMMLDQASSYTHYNHTDSQQKSIQLQDIQNMLSLVAAKDVIKFIELIISKNAKDAISVLDEIYMSTSNIEYFIYAVTDFIAEINKMKAIPDYRNPLYDGYKSEVSDILNNSNLGDLSVLWQIFHQGVHEIKNSHNELIAAQMLIIKAVYSCSLPSIEDIKEDNDKSESIKSDIIQKKTTQSLSGIPEKLYSFIKYCFDKKEMRVYYKLLNEVEIQQFDKLHMKISSLQPISRDINNNIRSLLKEWSNEDWEISVEEKNEIIAFKKTALLQEAQESKSYNLVKNNFPKAEILDIIMKNQ